MQRYLFGLFCSSGFIIYGLFETLENRGRALSQKPRTASVRGASPPSRPYKGGVLYAMRKNMWNCLGQWARSQDAEDYDLTVNVGLDGRYCVRAGIRANETYA